MRTKKIWIVFTKSRLLPGCSIDMDGCEFYFAEVLVPTGSSVEALTSFDEIIAKVKNALAEDKYAFTTDVNLVFGKQRID